MDNYEKRLFLKYFYALFDAINFDTYRVDRFIIFFINEFNISKNCFEYDKNGDLLLNTGNQIAAFKKKFKPILKDLIKKIPKKNAVFEKQLLFVNELFKLTKIEAAVFEFMLIQEFSESIKELIDYCGNNSLHVFIKNEFHAATTNIMRQRHSLYKKNVLKSKYGEWEINANILKIFGDSKCDNMTKAASILLGESQKCSLKKIDFEHMKKEQKRAVKILKSAIEKKQKGVNILLYGDVGLGKTEFAKLTANLAKVSMYLVKTEDEDFKEAGREERLVDLQIKQKMLSYGKNSCILFDEAEDVMNRGFSLFGNASKGHLNNILENTPVPIIWTTNDIYGVDPAFLRRMTYAIEFEKLSEENRLKIWKKVLKKNDLKVSKAKLEKLNKTYDIQPSLISNAVQSTKMIDGDENDFENFIENVATVVTKKKNIKNENNFEVKKYDINLVNTDIEIENLTKKIQKSKKLNFSLCLYGEPGTGKSQYARYLADKLGIDVIFKRASDLISKWVGETEKNIAEAFAEAKSKGAMLIFDEADSFLQNRNNAQRSWEISQVNEMLTWMESHKYPFVCTTNLLDTLDEASLRRFTFKIKFDFMTTAQVNRAVEHFFKIKNASLNIKGLTAGDFATVKKKADFLEIKNLDEIEKMLIDEVKVKKSKALQKSIGF